MGAIENLCFEKNVALLKKNHTLAWEKVCEAKDDVPDSTALVFAGNNKPNLKIKLPGNKSIFIHDRNDPGRESDAFLSMVPEKSTGVVLILGMGLGYLARAIAQQRKKIQHIIIFELNIEFFIHALKNMDLVELLEDKRVGFSLGEPEDVSDILKPANRAFMLENIHTSKLIPCFQVNNSYDTLATSVFEYVSEYNMEGATKTKHGQSFFENRIKHLTSIHHDRLLEDLTDKFKGVPALIIAAGPSLDKNIDQIGKAVGKSVIFSVDTALPSLLKHGIKPDFVTSIDYKSATYEKIAGVTSDPLCQGINLICASWVTPVVPKTFPGKNVFWAFTNSALENWINVSLGGKIAVDGAGTVAHMNLISAKIMGCDPVIFVGQDLAFSENRDHSSNVVLTNKESMERMLNDGQDILWVKGVNGPDVPTTRAFLSYKLAFERMIAHFDGEVINSTEGGAVIEGTQELTLAASIDRFCNDRVEVGDSYGQRRFNLGQSIKSILTKLIKLEKTITKADRLAVSILKDLAGFEKNRESSTCLSTLPLKLQKKIIELDSCHHKADKNPLWSLFDDMTMEGMRQDEREKNELEILEAIPGKYLEWLSKSIVRTDRVNKLRIKNLGKFKKQLNALINYHSNEKALLDRMEGTKFERPKVLELANLYYQSENYVLLERLLVKYDFKMEGAAVNYYSGIIALYRGEYGKAERSFQLSIESDESYEIKIFDKRYEMADHYVEMAGLKKGSIPPGGYNQVIRYLLLKGLKCCPTHGKLRDAFGKMAENDLQTVMLNIETSDKATLQKNKGLLENWIGIVTREKELQKCIGKNILSEFYWLYGNLLLESGDSTQALDCYQKALSLFPDNPDLHIAVTDACFALGDFDSGLESLKKAVDIDKNCAVYWKNMGDSLQAQKDYNNAIMAYEQYFMALPKQVEVLKNIGDCHKKLGNLDAAYEAYQQFKKIILDK
ncbi:conserved hypothetical protein [Desulforapulum autotrophicum HRM2]|uniref:Uncharacterized protein n=2 Tax=Desulforapulum autotrophicum TaxID=2296 RepID=C0QA27_DESAH|nr:conserved hypothetical protein [Desulforapulum autotrophicum HRM2]